MFQNARNLQADVLSSQYDLTTPHATPQEMVAVIPVLEREARIGRPEPSLRTKKKGSMRTPAAWPRNIGR